MKSFPIIAGIVAFAAALSSGNVAFGAGLLKLSPNTLGGVKTGSSQPTITVFQAIVAVAANAPKPLVGCYTKTITHRSKNATLACEPGELAVGGGGGCGGANSVDNYITYNSPILGLDGQAAGWMVNCTNPPVPTHYWDSWATTTAYVNCCAQK